MEIRSKACTTPMFNKQILGDVCLAKWLRLCLGCLHSKLESLGLSLAPILIPASYDDASNL